MERKQLLYYILSGLGVLVLAVVAVLLWQRAGTQDGSVLGNQTQKQLVVAASIFPLADITRHVGGDKISVVTILPPGASEHTYEPTPEAVRNVQNARLFFKVGYGLDDWTDQIAQSVNRLLPVHDVSTSIELRTYAEGAAHEHDDHEGEEEVHEDESELEKGVGYAEDSFDPHYFLTLENGARIAETIGGYLAQSDPANADYYRANASAYAATLRAEDIRIKEQLAALPDKKIITFHEAWFYFANHYGLEIVTTFEPFPGQEPTASYLAHFIEEVKESGVKVLFTEPQFSSASISQVASDLNLRLAVLDPIGGSTPETNSYLDTMRFNANNVAEALSK